jgi:putative membrane protein
MSTIRINGTTVAALLLVASVAACKKEQTSNGVDTTAAATARVDTAMTPGNPSAAPGTTAATPANNWTSPNIIGFAEAANTGEIALGKLGAKKATNADVKAFAKMMVTDHSAMLSDAKKLATKANATPDTTFGDTRDLVNHGNDEVKDLTDKAAGADWDKDFMDKMIDDHQKVLDKLQDAAKNTTDADTQKALEASTAKVQAHLTKAQDIKAKLQ